MDFRERVLNTMSKIKVSCVDSMGSDLSVVNAARVSFGKSSDSLTKKDEKLIKYLADHEHLTPFESCLMTVRIECPLYIRSQIMRHRTASFNEISRRYTSENIEFFEVDEFRAQHLSSKQCSAAPLSPEDQKKAKKIVEDLQEANLKSYYSLLALGVSREQARAVLPQSLMTSFYMTMNLRNWAHFIKLRIDAHSQKEAQDVAKLILTLLENKFPISIKNLIKN